MKNVQRVVVVTLGLLIVLTFAGYQWISSEREKGSAFDPSLSPNIFQFGLMNVRATLFNDPSAQFALGRYERFVNLDYSASKQWMEKSAANGYPEALYMLAAEMLNSGEPLSNDQKIKAYEMMRNAAKAGNVLAKQYIDKNPEAQ